MIRLYWTSTDKSSKLGWASQSIHPKLSNSLRCFITSVTLRPNRGILEMTIIWILFHSRLSYINNLRAHQKHLRSSLTSYKTYLSCWRSRKTMKLPLSHILGRINLSEIMLSITNFKNWVANMQLLKNLQTKNRLKDPQDCLLGEE